MTKVIIMERTARYVEKVLHSPGSINHPDAKKWSRFVNTFNKGEHFKVFGYPVVGDYYSIIEE